MFKSYNGHYGCDPYNTVGAELLALNIMCAWHLWT